MRKAIFCFCIFTIAIWHSFAQQTIISGRIVDSKLQSPIQDANISLSENGSTLIVAYAVSDKHGNYSLTYNGKSERITVSLSGFNLKKQSKTIDNQSQTVNFFVEEENICLNEVIVNAAKIKQSGDTLTYNVLQFTDKEDRSIGDVLKKNAGY